MKFKKVARASFKPEFFFLYLFHCILAIFTACLPLKHKLTYVLAVKIEPLLTFSPLGAVSGCYHVAEGEIL